MRRKTKMKYGSYSTIYWTAGNGHRLKRQRIMFGAQYGKTKDWL